MSESTTKQLVVTITHGLDHELASVGFTIANGAITSGLDVAIFLTSSGVDLVRRGAADLTHAHPLEPLKNLVSDFIGRGGTVWACTPCVKARGYEQDHLIEGVIVTGASPMLERIKNGAGTLTF